MWGKGKLDDHSGHVRIGIQCFDNGEEIVERSIEWETSMFTVHANTFTCLKFPSDVRRTRCLFPYLEDDEMRLQFIYLLLQRCEERLGRFFAEENAC